MYRNNNMKRDDDDLKFIPLSIKEPFIDKESNWLPMIDLNLPEFRAMTDGFVFGFATPINNSNLEGASLKTLDYVPNNNVNVPKNNLNAQNTNTNKEKKEFEENFDLYYPSETLGEELFSYNKDENCKNFNNFNANNINSTQMNNVNNINNVNEIINNSNMNQNRQGKFEEPIHMELLRNLNFDNLIEDNFRGEGNKIKDIDNIFNIIKEDNSIIETFKAYNMPKPIYELILKKIIKTTLENSKYRWGD